MTAETTRLPDGSVPVLLSSHVEELLREEAASICAYLEAHEDVGPAEVASALAATRPIRRHRALVAAKDRDGLIAALRAFAADGEAPGTVVASGSGSPKVAFVYPGQGNQRRGMGKVCYERSEAFRAETDRCDRVFQECFGISPLDYLLDRGPDLGGSARVVQPALFLQMMGLTAMWRAAGVEPGATVGHSLGELVAAHVAGMIGLRDAITVVMLRAELIERLIADGFAMAVLGVDREACEALIARQPGWAEVSVVNSAHLVGLSGDEQTVARIVAEAQGAGVFARQIRVPYPAHISMVNQFREAWSDAFAGRLEHPELLGSPTPCVGGCTGDALPEGADSAEYWFRTLRNVVRFDLAVAKAVELGVEVFVEISEHPMLLLAMLETAHAARPAKPPVVVGTSRRTTEDLGEFTRNVVAVAVGDPKFPWPAWPGRAPLPGFPPVRMQKLKLWAHAPAAPVAPAPQAKAEELSGPAPQALISDPAPEAAARALGPEELAELVRAEVTRVMGAGEEDFELDGSEPLVLLGLDSMQALELRKRVQERFGREVPLTALMAGASLDEVVEMMTQTHMQTTQSHTEVAYA
ncbi:MAG: acyltransferase domain-containing protein [Segniliparus sp.]|uniref:acyltransferase domain-containing protein n=1 Tax=Segniliparus sp. TaxID=2804064 RepID=UPI003F2E07CF